MNAFETRNVFFVMKPRQRKIVPFGKQFKVDTNQYSINKLLKKTNKQNRILIHCRKKIKLTCFLNGSRL